TPPVPVVLRGGLPAGDLPVAYGLLGLVVLLRRPCPTRRTRRGALPVAYGLLTLPPRRGRAQLTVMPGPVALLSVEGLRVGGLRVRYGLRVEGLRVPYGLLGPIGRPSSLRPRRARRWSFSQDACVQHGLVRLGGGGLTARLRRGRWLWGLGGG